MAGSQRLIRLRRAGAITYRLIVSDRGIVTGSRSLKCHRRLFIKIQPVHSHTDFLVARNLANFLQFNTGSRTVGPRVDTVESNLAAGRNQAPDLTGDIGSTVA